MTSTQKLWELHNNLESTAKIIQRSNIEPLNKAFMLNTVLDAMTEISVMIIEREYA